MFDMFSSESISWPPREIVRVHRFIDDFMTLVEFAHSLLSGVVIYCFHARYSYRSASSGSTCAALRAGSQQAINATNVSRAVITKKVNGSVPLTP
jgi:hypothetical protein